MASPLEKPKKYEGRLASAFGFDEADLEVNQQGRRSPKQIARLKSIRNRQHYRLVLLSIVSLLIALGFYRYTAHVIPFGTVLFLALLLIPALEGPKLHRLRADLAEEAIVSAEGRIELSLNTRQNKAEYFLQVEGMWLPINKAKFLALKNGDPYRIYYTRRTKHILAVEWLREGDEHLFDATGSETEKEPAQMELVALDEKPKRFTD